MARQKPQLVSEIYAGEPYEYYPLAEHIVSAPGICGGRPTFKYTRIDVHHAMALLSAGWTVDAYCVVCLTLLPDRSAEISSLLRRLFRLPAFKTKASRMGKVARISGGQVIYYQPHDSATSVLPLP